ncbi:MAG: hypothetical protein EXS05_16215 [Planctomycetaceae bacterium]|nr:hypothetical protein [Planctomycetaceae bacterium]
MADSKNPPPSGGNDDPWEQLAEDLFGLELGKEHSAGAAEASAAPVQARPPVAPPPAKPVPPPPAFEFETPKVAPAPRPHTPVTESAVSLPESTPSGSPAPAAEPTPQDSYWDALANWNWDDGEGGGGKGRRAERSRSETPRSRDEGRSSTPDHRSERPAPPKVESRGQTSALPAAASDDDFGRFDSGNAPAASDRGAARSDVPPNRQANTIKNEAVDDSAEDAADDDDGDDDAADSESGTADAGDAADGGVSEDGSPRKRRRRRRRRGRGRGGDAEATAAPGGQPPAAGAPGVDWEQPSASSAGPASSAVPAGRRRDDRPRQPHAAAERTEKRRDADSSRPPRPRRDERRDERGPPSAPAPAAAESRAPSDDEFEFGLPTEQTPQAEVDDSDDSGEPAVSYDDVPTWEDAISYLLNPTQVQGDSGGSGGGRGGPPPADQPRQTRHYGGRKSR